MTSELMLLITFPLLFFPLNSNKAKKKRKKKFPQKKKSGGNI